MSYINKFSQWFTGTGTAGGGQTSSTGSAISTSSGGTGTIITLPSSPSLTAGSGVTISSGSGAAGSGNYYISSNNITWDYVIPTDPNLLNFIAQIINIKYILINCDKEDFEKQVLPLKEGFELYLTLKDYNVTITPLTEQAAEILYGKSTK